MNFKQFLQERFAEVPSSLMTDKIEIQCEQFIKASKGKGFLLRGIKGLRTKSKVGDILEGVGLYHVDVRKDRKPLSMPPAVSSMIDDYLEKKFGVRARSQSAFCYGESERSAADGYGDVAAVFPIGEFKLIWSPKVEDLWDMFDAIRMSLEIEGAEIRTYSEEKVLKWIASLGYTDKAVSEALQSESELMLVCDSYYAMPAQPDNVRALKEALKFE